MISAFKHIRLSGYNLTPIQSAAWDNSSTLRLGFGNSGLAYYSELTGISGYLKSLIDVANADVNSVNNLTGNIYITGQDGITIDVNSSLGEIKVIGNSGYFQALSNEISSNLALTGSILDNKIDNLSGYANATYVAKTSQQVFRSPLAPGLDAYASTYPVPFVGTPKVQATLEVPGEVMYNLSVRSVGSDGYTGVLSDNIAESPVYIHTFASTQI